MATTGTRSAARSAAARLAGLVALTFVLAGMLAPAASAVGSPDLTITKTSDAVGTLTVGDRFTYTLTVSNVGTATAHDVIVSDDFPTGLSFHRAPSCSCPEGTAPWRVRRRRGRHRRTRCTASSTRWMRAPS